MLTNKNPPGHIVDKLPVSGRVARLDQHLVSPVLAEDHGATGMQEPVLGAKDSDELWSPGPRCKFT